MRVRKRRNGGGERERGSREGTGQTRRNGAGEKERGRREGAGQVRRNGAGVGAAAPASASRLSQSTVRVITSSVSMPLARATPWEAAAETRAGRAAPRRAHSEKSTWWLTNTHTHTQMPPRTRANASKWERKKECAI